MGNLSDAAPLMKPVMDRAKTAGNIKKIKMKISFKDKQPNKGATKK